MSSLLRTACEDVLTNKNILVKDVFVINNYKGNGSTVKINNSLDMTNGNYMVKIKNNDNNSDNIIYDTKRGVHKELVTNKTFSESLNLDGLISFNNGNYSVGISEKVNILNNIYTSITIKKHNKFFDIVEYVGDGLASKTINHEVNCEIGLITIKALDIYSNWIVRHKDATGELTGEQPYPQQSTFNQIIDINTTTFKVANNANLLGVKYIAYIYAHNSLASGFIQCGSYTGGYQEVRDRVIGTGFLKIPDDVKEITITCSGGTGGNNYWYDPGQPYVQGVPEQKYIPPTYAWAFEDEYSMTTAPVTNIELWESFVHTRPSQPEYAPTGEANPLNSDTFVYVEWWIGTMDNPVFKKGHYSSYLVDPGQPFIEAIPEQPYKAPTSGGDIYSGGFSKVIINDITHVFNGGAGGIAVPETKTIILEDKLNRTINYNIASGGSLIYNYKTGGETKVEIGYTLSPTVFSTDLINRGSIDIPIGIEKVTINCSGGIGSNDTYLSMGQPYIAPVYLSEGQPYIAAVVGQPYIAPRAAVTQQGLPAYPNGLPAYVAGVPGVAAVAAQTIPASWRYTDWDDFAPTFWSQFLITSKYLPYDLNNYDLKYLNQRWAIVYAHQPPGSDFYYVSETDANAAGTEVAGQVPLDTQRSFTCRYSVGNATIYKTMNLTWYESEYIPAVTGVTAVPQQGLPEYPSGLPAYVAPVTSHPGQPYIAPVVGQPYIAPVYISEGQPYIAPVYLNPGQPYIAPTPYDPGQPFIAAVTGQQYIAPTAAVAQQGLPAYPDGLPAYEAGVTGVTGSPEKITPAGWRFNLLNITAEEFSYDTGFPSIYFNDLPGDPSIVFYPTTYYNANNELILDSNGYPFIEWNKVDPPAGAVLPAKELLGANGERIFFRYFYKSPPGTMLYLVTKATADSTGEIFEDVSSGNSFVVTDIELAPSPLITTRSVYMNWHNDHGSSGGQNFKATYYETETIPAVPNVTAVPQKGLPEYPTGLPVYKAAVSAHPGQPYIAAVTGQPYIAPSPSTPGQPYIAPIIGVGDLVGPPSYISLNNSTFKFDGSLGFLDPTISRNILSLSGDKSQTLIYDIPKTGYLNISYEITNYDKTVNSNFKPYYLLIKCLTKPGDWIEIDCRKPDFNLKQNKSDAQENINLLTINDNGFSPKHITINELEQDYIYLVIRK